MRHLFNRLALPALLVAVVARPAIAWPPGGVVAAPVPGQDEPRVLLGKQGSVLAFWSDYRWHEGFADLYGQLLTSSGQVAPGWPDTGLMIARAFDDQRPAASLSHPDGSFILGILDFRNAHLGGTGVDIFFTRVLPDGRIDPSWPREGFQATERVGSEYPRRMVWVAPDTLVACSFDSHPDGVYRPVLQRVAVTPAGPQLPWGSQGIRYDWRPNGLLSTVEIAPDDAGGAFVVFDEYLAPLGSDTPDGDLYVMRLGRDGQPAAGWEAGAKPVCIAPGAQELGVAQPDGAGGVFIAWADAREGAGMAYPDYLLREDIRLLRLTADGVPAAGWPADGLLVSNAPGWQYMPSMVPDGAGGVYVAWDDITIGLTRVRGDGTFAPGWAQNGIQVSDLFTYATNARLVLDGTGGVYVLFEDVSFDHIVLQHARGGGSVDPVWPTSGKLVSVGNTGDFVSDGAGGCYVAYLTQPVPFGPTVVTVNRFGIDGVVPVKLAEATADAEPGRVHLVWRGAEGGAADARVQRRDEERDWRDLGAPVVLGRDEVGYDDLTAEPGASYDYRLVRGAEVLSEEISVKVPAAAVFALAGATPNPALARELTVAFSLTGSAPAKLEVLDLAGRREYARPLSGLAPGRHALPLADASLPPGVHWLRLTEGARSAHARLVVVR